jgi:cob(I)alamin adenosyltransferase
MVHLDRITTRTGDDGSTGLGNGMRVRKDHPLIAVLGSVDEANSMLGLALTEPIPADIAAGIRTVQNDLFDLGADLCMPSGGPHEDKIPRITQAQITRLEAMLEVANRALPKLASFVLPGGSRAAALLHVVRTIVRRAERDLVTAGAQPDTTQLNHRCFLYLNRLSDCCFVWARCCNDNGAADVLWAPGQNR